MLNKLCLQPKVVFCFQNGLTRIIDKILMEVRTCPGTNVCTWSLWWRPGNNCSRHCRCWRTFCKWFQWQVPQWAKRLLNYFYRNAWFWLYLQGATFEEISVYTFKLFGNDITQSNGGKKQTTEYIGLILRGRKDRFRFLVIKYRTQNDNSEQQTEHPFSTRTLLCKYSQCDAHTVRPVQSLSNQDISVFDLIASWRFRPPQMNFVSETCTLPTCLLAFGTWVRHTLARVSTCPRSRNPVGEGFSTIRVVGDISSYSAVLAISATVPIENEKSKEEFEQNIEGSLF